METENKLVMDMGSHSIKIGFTTFDKPKHVPNFVGIPRASSVYTLGTSRASTGGNALRLRGVHTLHPGMRNGEVENWDYMDRIWSGTFYQTMELEDMSDHPLLLAKSAGTSRRAREQMIRLAFERYNVPKFYLENTGKLALIARNINTGIALDIGDGVVTAMPVFEGMNLSCALQRNEYIMDRLHARINEDVLIRNDRYLRETAAALVCREIKVKLGNGLRADLSYITYVLPDGEDTVINCENVANWSECLFACGDRAGDVGIDEMVVNCVSGCDESVQDLLRKNIVVTGGSSKLPGVVQLLASKLAEKNENFHIVEAEERMEAEELPWFGGAKYAEQLTEGNWITKSIYEEFGLGSHRLCF